VTAERKRRVKTARQLELDQRAFATALASKVSLDGRAIFEQTKNPLYPWQVYGACRSMGQPVPQWVLNYLDACAGRLAALLAVPRLDDPDDEVLRAFGFKRERGQRTWFAELKNTRDASHLARRAKESGAKPYLADEETAKLMGVSRSAVYRARRKSLR
jgi:hypothetical protein